MVAEAGSLAALANAGHAGARRCLQAAH